ncbi:NADPH-dependent F420 reductase [Gammaproteobacteria bacterium]|nr:NADPH-dependent F420 reductase [Gammaproteobacteria bacterium]MDA8925373.1 NADPH-dependent F420 reductase [Gammaproteobacteria bacterium]MDA9048409.1 NADPH-dependent F420 reductase [Gammaproteobacteria bacterium]MDB9896199.1 NADPH-dependent F420 reductase [Gammaproteobacteria bacterium]MDC1475610.1 NADPH-dependent F420 reductase [Gammaproteobacteria bacterium]|tara:strand:- start:8571 stop:9203 length:633 start_codon:yes stop_codon:yes gene_type:complete
MKIAILGGTGALGKGLASRWMKANHEVLIGSRDIAKAKEIVAELGLPDSHAYLNIDAAEHCDIACITVPFAHQEATLLSVDKKLKDKILIDATVPLVPPKVMRVQLPKEGSAALKAQGLLGEDTIVVSAFQNISAELLQTDKKIDCDVLVSGDFLEARTTVIGLVEDAGLKGWHAGPLCNSVAAEALTSILIAINKKHALQHSGIKITGI